VAEFLYDYGLFFLKMLTIVIAIVFVVFTVVASGMKNRKSGHDGEMIIRKVNEHLEDMQDALSLSLLEPMHQKQALKEKKAAEKAERKAEKQAIKRAKKQRGGGETVINGFRW